MGAPLDVYTLHTWHRADAGRVDHVLVRCVRPAFPNWSQGAEDDAVDAAGALAAAALARLPQRSAADHLEELAPWEDALPNGDHFYDPSFSGPVDIWIAWHRRPGFMVFGEAPDEAAFWRALAAGEAEDDLIDLASLRRPAEPLRVLFVQRGGAGL